MWVLVFFDLPSATKKERKAAAKFRKDIMGDGFTMFQFSIYTRHCASPENAETHVRRVTAFMPEQGKVGILTITDNQFASIRLFFNRKEQQPAAPAQQLELL